MVTLRHARLSLLIMIISAFALARGTVEAKKSATVKGIIIGCEKGILQPNVDLFMKKAKADGPPFKSRAAAQQSINQWYTKFVKSNQYKLKLEPIALAECRCAMAPTIARIKTAKNQADLNNAIKDINPSSDLAEKCEKKYASGLEY